MIKAIALWAVARLQEPSTWAGIASLVTSMSFLPHASADAALIPVIGAAVAGAVAIVKADA